MHTKIDYSAPMTDIVEKARKRIDKHVLNIIETIAPYNYFARRDEVKALIGEYIRRGHISHRHAHMLYGAVNSKSMEVGKKMGLGAKNIEQKVQSMQPESHYVPPHHQHHETQTVEQNYVPPHHHSEQITQITQPDADYETRRIMRGRVAEIRRHNSMFS